MIASASYFSDINSLGNILSNLGGARVGIWQWYSGGIFQSLTDCTYLSLIS